MTRFLLDANLSPKTALYLQETLGFEALHIRDIRPGTISDEEVVAVAKQFQTVIITFDTDFGEMYHFREHGVLGVIQLELQDQTPESVHRVLETFFREKAEGIDLASSLVVLEVDRVRVIGPE